MKYYVLHNPDSNNGHGNEDIQKLKSLLASSDIVFINNHEISSYSDFFKQVKSDECVVLAGGDGTINYFINHTSPDDYKGISLYYFPAGTGNDFLRDAADYGDKELIPLNRYLSNLPTVTICGKTSYFINNVGYGIDGYCCEVADKIKLTSNKPINYTAIAIKGLLFHYKPTNATVTVDGKDYTYKKVWLAPTMKGKFYGGGMMPTPAQNRFDPEGKVSCMVMYGTGRIRTLMIFPGIFKGTHLSHRKACEVLSGKKITVQFDRATALQIDGETVLGVTSYTVMA